MGKKIRLAAGVMENLELMGLKMKKMSEAKDLTIEEILEIDDEDLSKSKEEHINEIETDSDKTIKGIRDLESSSEPMNYSSCGGILALYNRFLQPQGR